MQNGLPLDFSYSILPSIAGGLDFSLKREWLNRFKIFDYKHAYRLVFEYIETFYNTVRIHSHCGYLSPDEYEKQYRNKLLELEQKLAG